MVRQELGVLYRGLAQLAPQLRRRGQQGPAAVTLNTPPSLQKVGRYSLCYSGDSLAGGNDMVE